jgi:hypothetical protein
MRSLIKIWKNSIKNKKKFLEIKSSLSKIKKCSSKPLQQAMTS